MKTKFELGEEVFIKGRIIAVQFMHDSNDDERVIYVVRTIDDIIRGVREEIIERRVQQ